MRLLAARLAGLVILMAVAGLGAARAALAEAGPVKLKVSVPGPRNLSFLPIDLIVPIGADRAEGAEVHVRYVDGGSTVLQDLSSRNADFGVAGLPAMLSQQANNGQKLTVLAAVNDLPLYALMVRAGLGKEVKSPADLRGRVIGVTASSLTSKTTSQQLVELLLTAAGVPREMIRMMPVGQSWTEQSAALAAGAVDAVMSFEPVASRLQAGKLAYPLVNLAAPKDAAAIAGAGFLMGALATRPEVVEGGPRKAEKMVAILRRSLQWIATHTPEQVVAALEVKDPEERAALVRALTRYGRLYSPDGRFSGRQLRETEIFFQKAHAGQPAAGRARLDLLVDDRWAGRKE